MKFILHFLLILSFIVSAQIVTDSTDAGYPYRRIVKPPKTKGMTVLLSVVIPGGGHFYLGNHKTGLAYLAARTAPIVYAVTAFDKINDSRTRDQIGTTLAVIALGSWIGDVLHAGISAYGLNRENENISFNLEPDPVNKHYGFELVYYFK